MLDVRKIRLILELRESGIVDSKVLSAIEKMNTLKITSLLVSKHKEIKKKNKNVIGVLHLHHCLSKGIK